MAALSKAAYEAKYNDSSTGIYKDGQGAGAISEGDHRDHVEDTADSAMFLSDNFIDEDDFASDSATKAPSQQSTAAFLQSPLYGVGRITINISGTQILSANSSPIQLVAAPGAGFAYLITSPVILSMTKFSGTPFTANTNSRIRIGTTDVTEQATILDVNVDSIEISQLAQAKDATSAFENQPIRFYVETGDPSDGNAADSLDIIFNYRTVVI